MHRILVASLALLAMAQEPAMAQACMGLASFTTAPVQVTANGSFSDLSTSVGANIGYGIPSSVFGTLGVATTSYEPDEGANLALRAGAGYQINIGAVRPVQVCPVATFGYGMGPSDDIAGFARSNHAATVGVRVGIEMTANPRMKVVPSAGLSYAQGKDKAEDNAGATLYEISSKYGLAQLGVGIILNQHFSLRPGVDIPLGREGGIPVVGITIGYNFSPRGIARRPR